LTPKKLTLRVSPSVARDIDAFLRTAKPALGHESSSRAGVVRTAVLSFLAKEFDPLPLGTGHADFPEKWGRILPRPADTLTKVVKEPLSIRITFRISPGFASDLDIAVKRRNFRDRASLIRAVTVGYLAWRSRPDTLVKTAYPPSVASVASSVYVYS